MSDATETHGNVLDHEYDGIQEYDNPMPGWWVWIFILSFLFAFPYLAWFHIGVGPSMHQQYEAEVGDYYAAQMKLLGELQADEATILTFMADDNQMLGMSSLFKSKCATCHKSDGGGATGPNMTDDFYINIENVEDIAEIIRTGVPAKGMTAWDGKLSDNQIVLLASYIASLRGSTPAVAKAAQGKRIAPWPDPPPPGTEPAAGDEATDDEAGSDEAGSDEGGSDESGSEGA